MKKYIMKYWLPKQSREFTYPQIYSTDSCEELINALLTMSKSGYEVKSINILEVKDE